MYTFIPAASEYYDLILNESYAKCNSVFSMMELNDLITESESGKESGIKKIFTTIKSFFKTIIKTLISFTNKIDNKFKQTSKNISIINEFKRVKKEVQKLKKSGVKTYEFYDVKEYDKCISKFVNEAIKLMGDWEQKISSNESTAFRAELFIKDSNSLIKKYTDKLSAIKSKTKNVDIDTIIKWVDDQINSKGVSKLTLKNFLNKVAELTSYTDKVEAKLNEYSDKSGYIPMAKSIKDVVNNFTIFIKKNYDWCAARSASIALLLISVISSTRNDDKAVKIVSNGEFKNMDDLQDQAPRSLAKSLDNKNKEDLSYAYSVVSNKKDFVRGRHVRNASTAGSLLMGSVAGKLKSNKQLSGTNSIYGNKIK